MLDNQPDRFDVFVEQHKFPVGAVTIVALLPLTILFFLPFASFLRVVGGCLRIGQQACAGPDDLVGSAAQAGATVWVCALLLALWGRVLSFLARCRPTPTVPVAEVAPAPAPSFTHQLRRYARPTLIATAVVCATLMVVQVIEALHR